MNGLIEGKFDAGGLTGPEFEMTPIQWPEGGQGCTLDYNSDSTFGLDEVSEKYTIVFSPPARIGCTTLFWFAAP